MNFNIFASTPPELLPLEIMDLSSPTPPPWQNDGGNKFRKFDLFTIEFRKTIMFEFRTNNPALMFEFRTPRPELCYTTSVQANPSSAFLPF